MEQELPSVVELNVGGTRFTTRLTTLRKYPDSMLAAMFSGRHKLDRDRDENIFIDRKGEYFDDILEFLRDEQCLPPAERCEKVLREAEYFGLVQLEDRLKNKPPLFPVYKLLEKNRTAVEDYFTIKEKVKYLATFIADNQTNKSACRSTESGTVGSIISTIIIVTYNTIQFVERPANLKWKEQHVSSLEKGMNLLFCNECSCETFGVEDKEVVDYAGFINTLAHDLQQEGYSLSVNMLKSSFNPHSTFIFNEMEYVPTRTVNFVFKWNLIPKNI